MLEEIILADSSKRKAELIASCEVERVSIAHQLDEYERVVNQVEQVVRPICQVAMGAKWVMPIISGILLWKGAGGIRKMKIVPTVKFLMGVVQKGVMAWKLYRQAKTGDGVKGLVQLWKRH